MDFTYKYPRMLVTVDILVFNIDEENQSAQLLLVKRGNNPYKGLYAIPGGFPEMDELLVDAAKRELNEETGLSDIKLKQLAAFDKVDRDPRDRNISVTFYGFTTPENSILQAGDDAEKAEWFPLESLPPLAFDHADIITYARQKINI